MAFGFFRKKKPTQAQTTDSEFAPARAPDSGPGLAWNDRAVYELLCKIDGGYRPTPAEGRALAERETLNLSYTQITALPESLGQLANLQILSLYGTQITALPESLGQLTNLRYLYLDSTRITALPEWLGQLAKLQYLDLCRTQITALPEWLGQLANLQTLYLGGTQITALPEWLGQLANLQSLSLFGTPIIALPESLDRLAKLQFLSLTGTQITALPGSLGQLTNLRSLYLDRTRITALPDWLGELPALNRLDLRDLSLPRLPRSLALRGLPFVDTGDYDFSGVNLRGLTLTEQDKAVFLQNDRALIEALYQEEQLRLPECRVIFLGDGDSGKSYTIRRFRNGGRRETAVEPYETRETPGVEILNQDVPCGGSTLCLHFWDFGGQQLLHAMHRCFLTEDSCYVVTVKSRETKADQRARYWLRNVTAFAPKSPILLYVNCWDNDNGLRVLDEPRLRKEFPQYSKGGLRLRQDRRGRGIPEKAHGAPD